MKEKERLHVWIEGRVQGVFFRQETQRAARSLGVAGWVRNLADGRVEAVFEGDAADVETMAKWCWKGSPRSEVTAVDRQKEPFTGEFSVFDILR